MLPKASRNWLRYICAGRVRLLELLSMNAPVAMASNEMNSGITRWLGLMVSALLARPATAPSSITQYSVRICSLPMFSTCRKPTAPVDCSEVTMRIRITHKPRRMIAPLPSHRVISSGFWRLCSMARPLKTRAIDAARATPIHGASSHHSMRPSDRAAHSRAVPLAIRVKVRKSSGSKVLKRSPGGSLSSRTQPSAASARPSSNRYRPRHSAICSRSSEKIRASGRASCEAPRPSTMALRRHCAGNAWIM
ncbi:hypothetical protein D3C79_706860 [compost metagenome]